MSGFLGGLLNQLLGSGGANSGLAAQVSEHLAPLLSGDNLQGILQKAEQNGLGDKVRSWIGQQQNLPVSPDEIRSLLTNQQVEQLVARTGLPAETLLPALAQFLPTAVDHTTPDGKIG